MTSFEAGSSDEGWAFYKPKAYMGYIFFFTVWKLKNSSFFGGGGIKTFQKTRKTQPGEGCKEEAWQVWIKSEHGNCVKIRGEKI